MSATNIEIRLNGEQRRIAAGLNVAGLLQDLGFAGKQVAVERNRSIVRRDDFDGTKLREGDVLEIVTFVGGG